MLEALEIKLPTLSYQRSVARIIDTIRSKIQVNTKLNGYFTDRTNGFN